MKSSYGDVWFVLPTANEANCRAHLPAWRDMGYRVALLQDRARFGADADAIVEVAEYPGWGASVNRLFREVVPGSCDVIVAGGDDMLPDPTKRADEIRDEFLEHFGGSFGVMQPMGDDFEATRTICGSPWLGRAWMTRMYGGTGGMPEAYVHQWADDELYWVSRCAGAFWERRDLTQRHEHFLRKGEPAPAYWAESAGRNDERDCLTFIARSRAGFPGAAETGGVLDMSVFAREYGDRAERAYAERYGSGASRIAGEKMRAALAACARAGHGRVGIFGAGQHTRRAGEALCTPEVMLVAIIDEDPARVGTTMWGLPVVSVADALGLGLDAVVLSSDSMEDRLLAAARPLEAIGVRVVSLYGGSRVGLPEKASA